MMSEELRNTFAQTCVIVPALNEENSVGQVIQSIKDHLPGARIVVIDDGSIDETAQIGRAAGAIVLSPCINLGIGGAVQTGFKYALNHGFDTAIQIDGDGQHDPKEAHRLIELCNESGADIVIGSRWLGRGDYVAPTNRRIGMKILERLVNWRTQSRFTDTTSGFRAFNHQAIELFAKQYPTDYAEVETILWARHYGLNVQEVPVKMSIREHGESSIKGFRAAYFMLRISMELLIGVIGGDHK
jgi:glycosyltransferase involved in cell wall biosynthesis